MREDAHANPPSAPAKSQMTAVSQLRANAKVQPDKLLYTWLGDDAQPQTEWSYAQVEEKANAVAVALMERWHLVAGDRAVLMYLPGLDFIAGFWGCLFSQVVAVPVYPVDPRKFKLSVERFGRIVEACTPKVVLTHDAYARIKTATSIRHVFASACWPEGLEFFATDDLPPADMQSMPVPDPEALAFLQFTSGSTGDPKGVMLSHANIAHNCETIAEGFGLGSNSVGVSWLPQYHDMGLVGFFLFPAYIGSNTVLMSPVNFLHKPGTWLQAASDYKANYIGGPNFAYQRCVDKQAEILKEHPNLNLGHLILAMNAAEPVRAPTLRRFELAYSHAGFESSMWAVSYGLAENVVYVAGAATVPVVLDLEQEALRAGRVSLASSSEAEATQIVSCGKPFPGCGVEIAIVDSESRQRCAEKQIGEIWVRGGSKTLGYWNRPELTREMFHATIGEDTESYLRTGDLGFMYNDELFVCGRQKDLIIVNGKNVYPQDIEQSVEASHRSLRPGCSAAFALEVDGVEQLVVMAEVRQVHETPELCRDILTAIEAAILEEHGLRCYALLLVRQGQVPKTTSGKIKRFACKEAAQTWLDQRGEEASGSASWGCCDSRESSPLEFEVLDARIGQLAVLCRPLLPGKCTNRSDAVVAVQEAVEHVTGRCCAPDERLSGMNSMMVVALSEELTGIFGKKAEATSIMQADTINALCSLMLAGAVLSAREQEKERCFDQALARYNDDQPEGASRTMCGLRPAIILVQFLMPALIFLLATSCLVPVYYVGKGIQYDGWVVTPWSRIDLHPHATLGLLVPMLIPLWMTIFSVAVVLVKWILIGRYKRGHIRVNSQAYLCWVFVDRLVAFWELWVARFFKKTIALTIAYKVLGANIHTNSKVSTFIREFDLITVGEASTVDGDVVARTLYPEHVSFLPVVIGAGVDLQKFSCVLPGSRFADAVTLRPLSVAPLGSVADAGMVYCGNPMLVEPSTPRRLPVPGSHKTESCLELLLRFTCLYTMMYAPYTMFAALGLCDLALWTFPLGPLVHWVSLFWLAGILNSFLTLPLLKYTLVGIVRRGEYNNSMWRRLREHVLDFMSDIVTFMLLSWTDQTVILLLWARLLGSTIEAGVLASSPAFFDAKHADLICLKQGAFINGCSSFAASSGSGSGGVRCKHAYVQGKGSVVGFSCVLGPADVEIEEGAQVGALTWIPAGKVESGQTVFGDLHLTQSPVTEQGERPYVGALAKTVHACGVVVMVVTFMCAMIPGYLMAAYFLFGTFQYSREYDQDQAPHGAVGRAAGVVLLTVSALITVMSFVVLGVLSKWVFVGRYTPESHQFKLGLFFKAEVMTTTLITTRYFLFLFEGSPFMTMYFAMLGSKVAWSARLHTTYVLDHDLISIGEKAVVDSAVIVAHCAQLKDQELVLEYEHTHIGAGSVVQSSGLMLGGDELPRGCILGPRSKLMPHETHRPGSLLMGVPACAANGLLRLGAGQEDTMRAPEEKTPLLKADSVDRGSMHAPWNKSRH